ncbi:640_t:CDS:2 [Cetraspora pellucida]|uniref:640_t:CDS:1 n=1 Tax=Cetraspora pellucida TaxID=1433469 RepID=A0A9N8YZ47_9GLOM|nr:640_t:CDS:2 [Cetraspora pellucida]
MSKQNIQVIWYGGKESDDYSSDSDVYSDNISESRSENCSDYSSDYESDTETTIKSLILQPPPKVEEQVSNTTSSTEQVSPTYPKQDMSNNKGSLENIHLWDYLLSNYGAKEEISLLDAYTREELTNRLIIQIDQKDKQAPKFSVIDDISEIYGLPGIHECINRQRPLRPVIDIDAFKEKIEAENVNTKNVFFSICCSFVRALYQIFDSLLVDYLELKKFTELVFRLTRKKYKKFIDQGLPGRNFCLCLIGSAKKDCQNHDKSGKIFNVSSIIEKIQQKNKNNVPPPISHKIKGSKFPKPFLEMLGWVKYNKPLTASERYEERYIKPLSKENDIYIGSCWGMRKTYAIENLNIPENTKHQRVVCWVESLHRITNKCKCDKKCRSLDHASHKCPPNPYILVLDEILLIILQTQTCLSGLSISLANFSELITQAERLQKGKIFRLASDKKTVLIELWGWAKQMTSLPFEKADFPELRIKEYHGKSDLIEKTRDFRDVDNAWKNIDLIAYTSTLKIGVSCINPKFERAFCIFSSYIETNAGTNQILFCMQCIKDYICYIQQRASKASTTEEGKAGMVVSVIEPTPKPKDNTVLLTETVKECSSVIKAEEISDLANANIINCKMTEHLENKPKKTLEEMRALDQHYIVNCYNIAPEFLTEEFISEFRNYNHMFWFRALQKLRDAGTNNETAVEAISCEDYRNDRLTTVTRAEKHRICLGLLKICIPVKDIDDRNKYKTNIVKTRLELPESIKYLQELVPKMAQVFDNTDLKGTNNKHTHYHLVGAFDNIYAYAYTSELPLYQTGEDWDNGEDW